MNQRVMGSLLCLAALVFPFSVAVNNLLLALALVWGGFSGFLWRGMSFLWRRHRHLAMGMLAYAVLLLIGLLWSLDPHVGLRVIGHHWFWLVMPLMLVVFEDKAWQQRFLGSLSLGLTLHLCLCVLQHFGWYTVENLGGSTMDDATGHIGHIGFGVVYGIWAAWLLYWGWLHAGRERWLAWGLAVWSWGTIFAAQGRAGYLEAVVLMLVVVFLHARLSLRMIAGGLVGVALLGILAVSTESGQARMHTTVQQLQGMLSGDVKMADPRLSFWLVALEAWKQHPVLGVGTGGFPQASATIYTQQPTLVYPGLEALPPTHPHSVYMLALSRWGGAGLLAISGWLAVWLWYGRSFHQHSGEVFVLLPLTGVALLVDGIFAPTLEQHFTGVFLAMLLGLGLASTGDDKNAHAVKKIST